MLEVGPGDVQLEAALLARQRPAVGDVAELRHLPQHLVAPRPRRARVEDRVVLRRRLRQPGQQRRLRQGQLPDRLGEVDQRGGLDADRGAAVDRPVGGGVQVLAEDLSLRVALGVLDRQLRLDDLAVEVAVRVGDAEVADELLGDRRAALDRLPRLQVLERGAQDALGVDAAVLVEALVLDRDGRELELSGDAVDRDRGERLVGADDPQLAAVAGEEGRVAAPVDRFAGGERGRLGGDVEHPGGDDDCRDRDQDDDAPGREQQLRAGAASAPVASATALRHARKGTSARALSGTSNLLLRCSFAQLFRAKEQRKR